MMALRGTRKATHAGSWYTADPEILSSELDEYLSQVPNTIDGISLPIPRARVIIAPHAGYSYSGPCAAWAYKSLDLSRVKRVFILGPSHTYYLGGCALTKFAQYETPFGNLLVDSQTVASLRSSGRFSDIPCRSDEDEHSLEMHLPYLWRRLAQTHGEASSPSWPTIVPILIGDNDGSQEKSFAELLLPYFEDVDNAFLVSSDFCHWGRRFSYTGFMDIRDKTSSFKQLSGSNVKSLGIPIHEGIKILDDVAIGAVASGIHDNFVRNLAATKNTVCGRHPIGVAMAALEMLSKDSPDAEKGKFRFVQYQRSSLVERLSDSSVSYASAYAII